MGLATSPADHTDANADPPPGALYDPGMRTGDPLTATRDIVEAAALWRPQRFSESGGDVLDPLVEPLWTGLRALALVDHGTATFRDLDGDDVDDFPDIAEELAAAARADRLLLDGYLTHQPIQDPVTVARRDAAEAPNNAPTIGQMWFGALARRRSRAPKPSVEQMERDALPADGDVAFVVVDLLWLDEDPLLGIPLLERKRILESVLGESRLVRRGIYVRPPIDTWLGSWRSFGFSRLAYKAANSRYLPGETNPQWTVGDLPAR